MERARLAGVVLFHVKSTQKTCIPICISFCCVRVWRIYMRLVHGRKISPATGCVWSSRCKISPAARFVGSSRCISTCSDRHWGGGMAPRENEWSTASSASSSPTVSIIVASQLGWCKGVGWRNIGVSLSPNSSTLAMVEREGCKMNHELMLHLL
jgi:hypothetical protein